jgi:NhaP-type Na+/H+ or K+/H+ antiporter
MVIFNYSVYLIAEFSLIRVSGIISLVAYALYMNVFGKTIITGEVNKYVNTFWTYIVFVAETSIFLIAGVNIGVKAISS